MLFQRTGLSAAQISSLFVIWSVTAFTLEVPSGAWADAFSRRWLLVLAPLIVAAGYALWTFAPSYPAFAVGFVLWGAGGAIRSGTFEALAYEELARLGASGHYARVIGRSRACGTTAALIATGLAAPVMELGGYRTVGIASVIASLIGAAVGWSLPESRRQPRVRNDPVAAAAPGPGEAEDSGDEPDAAAVQGYFAVLRHGFAEVGRSRPIRRWFIIVAVLSGADAMEEYLALLAGSTGVHVSTVPLLLLLVSVGMAAGDWFAGRGPKALAPAVVVAAACLAGGAASGLPIGFLPIAMAYGILGWAMAAADARLQHQISDRSRATVTSMAGFGIEVVAVLVFAGYGLGSNWTGPRALFVIAALPYLIVALLLRRSPRQPVRGGRSE